MGTKYEMVVTDLEGATRDIRGDLYAGLPWNVGKVPMPLYYQPLNTGHEASETVGTVDEVIERDGLMYARGEMLDDEDEPGLERIVPIAREAIALGRRGLVAPSFDANAIAAEGIGVEDAEPEITHMELGAVTLVGQPAFTTTSIAFFEDAYDAAPGEADTPAVPADEDDPDGRPALVAAVHDTGWDALPVADPGHAWDGDEAAERIAADCGIDGDAGPDDTADAWSCYASAFLYRDDAADERTRGAYKLGVVDLVDGTRTLIPRAVFAVAAVLEGARGGADIPAETQDRLRTVVAGLYDHINDELGTEYEPTWDDDEGPDDTPADIPGESEAASARTALIAAITEPAPADAFTAPALASYTPGFQVAGRRIFGHVTNREACHMGWSDVCMTPPPSPSGYKIANRYTVRTSAGDVETGRLTSGLGAASGGCPGCRYCEGVDMDDHACISLGFTAAAAYHDTLTTLADIRIGEDEAGNVWAAGILREPLPAAAADILARRVWSGDWRPFGDAEELSEVVALHHQKPGFTRRVQHSRSRFALVAAAGPTAPPTPASAEDAARAAVAEYHRGLAAVDQLAGVLAEAEAVGALARIADA